MKNESISKKYIDKICELYDDVYDDRVEDSRPPAAGTDRCLPGGDWRPGQIANHKSLVVFQRELSNQGIRLSTSNIKKILISGGCWSTKRSREVYALFHEYTKPCQDGGRGMTEADAIKTISELLDLSTVTVSVNLPYSNVVYNLENKSSNAKRCERYKAKKRMEKDNDRERNF